MNYFATALPKSEEVQREFAHDRGRLASAERWLYYITVGDMTKSLDAVLDSSGAEHDAA
jgi:hypothetical protein